MKTNQKQQIEQRVLNVTNYILSTGATIRKAAKAFRTSKSTIHKDVTVRLEQISPQLYNEVKPILKHNFEVKHINGGIATKNKFRN